MALRNYLKQEEISKQFHSFLDHLKNRKQSGLFILIAAGFFYFLFLLNTSTLLGWKFLHPIKKNQVINPIASLPKVKGAVTEATPTPSPLPTAQPSPTSKPTPTASPKPKKTLYKIAVFGDSMVDTMGEHLEYLDDSLKKKYPKINFALYNYGIGSTNVEDGLSRFNEQFDYSSRFFDPLPQLQADIIVIGSFAYNPFTPYDRDRHWLGLTHLVQEAEKTSAKVYMLAEMAPLRSDFGKGPNGVNWESQTAYNHSGHIIEQLQNAIALSKILNVPLIDVFDKTYDPKSKGGQRKYVNNSDGIHPSVEGHKLMADIIAETLKLR